MNVADLLDARCEEHPYQVALVHTLGRHDDGRVAYTQLNFSQLRRLIDRYARGFVELGLKRGDRVSVFVRPGLDFPAVVFALFKVGCSPVFIDPGMGRKGVLRCLQSMSPRGLVAVPALHALRPLFRSALASVEITVTAGNTTGFWGGCTLHELGDDDSPFEPADMEPDEEAAILFTSGSTGPAKGVVYTHRILTGQTLRIQEMYGIEPGEVDVPGLPVFGLFSLAMGMTVVVPKLDPSKPASVDPELLVQTIEDHAATNAFGSPAIWRPVARWCRENKVKLPTLRRVLSAGAAVPLELHEAFREILSPGAGIQTPYGATEALPVATIGSGVVLQDTAARTRRGAGTCVGFPAPGIEVRIIQIEDGPIPYWSDDLLVELGKVGEICVRGEVVTRSYEGEPEATTAAKIRDGGTIWHRMGDLGYVDESGRLWFCGRKGHRVRAAGGDLYTVPLEEVFNTVDGVARTALVGVGEVGAQRPVLIVELEPGGEPEAVREAIRTLATHDARTGVIEEVLFHPSFPVDARHNAKIHRLELAAWATGQLR